MGSKVMISTTSTITIIISNLLLTATAYSFWPYHHVHIANELTGGKVLLVHCKSGTGDLGVRHVSPANEFTWRFRPGFLFASSLYFCYVAPDDGHHHLRFDAWTDHAAEQYEYGRNLWWVAKDDGVYVRIPDHGDQFWRRWDQGRSVMANDDDQKKKF